MITIALDGNYKVKQISADRIALYCTGGMYAHEGPMYITDLTGLDKMIENMHRNSAMMGNL